MTHYFFITIIVALSPESGQKLKIYFKKIVTKYLATQKYISFLPMFLFTYRSNLSQ